MGVVGEAGGAKGWARLFGGVVRGLNGIAPSMLELGVGGALDIAGGEQGLCGTSLQGDCWRIRTGQRRRYPRGVRGVCFPSCHLMAAPVSARSGRSKQSTRGPPRLPLPR